MVSVMPGDEQAPELVVEPGRPGLVTRARSRCLLIVHLSSIGTASDIFEADV